MSYINETPYSLILPGDRSVQQSIDDSTIFDYCNIDDASYPFFDNSAFKPNIDVGEEPIKNQNFYDYEDNNFSEGF